MGDIIGSERAPSMKAAHRAFNAAVDRANKANVEHIASPLTITLGDEFQGLLNSFAHAWAAAVSLRLELLAVAVPCRFVVGAARIETALNINKAWNMMGSGLSSARDKLNDKRTTSVYRFSFLDEPTIELLLNTVGDSLTEIEEAWTPTQLEYYTKSRTADRRNVEIAKKLGVSERSLYKVLRAGRVEAHRRYVLAIRSALVQLDERCQR